MRQESATGPDGCCLQDHADDTGRGGSASITQICAGAELLFARWAAPEPTSQTCAAECFRSRAEVLFARLHSRRLRSRSFCCWRLRSAACGVLLAVLLPVTGMAGAPLPRTVAAHLAIFRIGGDLLSVVVGAALSLTLGSAADCLAWLELRWLENLLAVATAPFTHTGVVASGYRRFRNCCRVRTASPPVAQPQNRRNCGRFSPAMTFRTSHS